MARLGEPFRESLGYSTWIGAYKGLGETFDEKPNSIKLLRDEFDVFFDNGRKGWDNREPHPSRFPILHEFEGVSDEALAEIARRLVAGDADAMNEILPLVAEPSRRAANVAERLMTGRKAEEFFMARSRELVDVRPEHIVDMRHRACGYDFGSSPLPHLAIEVKGLGGVHGDVLFTDREWAEAKHRGPDYWLVLVGQLSTESPVAKVVRHPVATFEPRCQIVQSAAATRRVRASVA